MCVRICAAVVYNAAQNSSDNFLSYLLDNHHSSDDVNWRGGLFFERQSDVLRAKTGRLIALVTAALQKAKSDQGLFIFFKIKPLIKLHPLCDS